MGIRTKLLPMKVFLAALPLAAVGYLALPASEGCACLGPKDYRAALKFDLRNLVTYEESFFADSARYTADLSALAFSPQTGDAVTVEAVSAGGLRASARVADSTLADRVGVCLLWYGDHALAQPGLPEAEPRCRVPRRTLWGFSPFGAHAWR